MLIELDVLRDKDTPISSHGSNIHGLLDIETIEDVIKSYRHYAQYSRSERFWLHSRLIFCWRLGIVVCENVCRAQAASLVNDFLSVLVLTNPESYEGSCIVGLKRIRIGKIYNLLESLADCFRYGFAKFTRRRGYIMRFASHFYKIQRDTEDLLANICISDDREITNIIDLEIELRETLTSTGKRNHGLELITAKCRYIFQALDLILLVYLDGHITNKSTVFGRNEQINLFDDRLLSFAGDDDWQTSYLRRMPMKCLAPLLGNRDVWVFEHVKVHSSPTLYLRTDIETFADVWGPVWKVKDDHEPNKIARYNVGEGSIIPWPFDPRIHPAIAKYERLCHWRSNFGFIKNDPSASDTGKFGTIRLDISQLMTWIFL